MSTPAPRRRGTGSGEPVPDEPGDGASEPVRGLVAVTGASGYVGVNLVAALRDGGWPVRAIDVHAIPAGTATASGDAAPAQPMLEHRVADVRDLDALVDAFDGADLVFHLAAKISLASDDPEAWDINVHGPATVAAAARACGVRRLVHCSSVHAFDLARARPILDEHSPRSTSPDRPIYDRSKAAGEVEVRKVVADGLDAVIVNPTGIIGPVDPGPSRINGMLRDASAGRVPMVVTGGFDWVDVRDVVAGLLAAAERGRTGENYLLPGHRLSALELCRMAARCTGHRGPAFAIPLVLAQPIAPLAERIGRWLGSDMVTPASFGAIRDDPVVDGTKARTGLGYEPRSLEQTVADLVAWFARRDEPSAQVTSGAATSPRP